MTLRVVQWTTGNIGICGVKAVLDHPDLELAGCFAFSADKVGRDVGELCKIEPLGIAATDDIDALLASGPDCVLYMPLFPDYDHVVRILEAGVNVVTTSAFINGLALGPELRDRVDAAARKGGASIMGTGMNPGLANVFGLVATQMCKRIDSITVLESVDATFYASPETWERTGFGLPIDDPKALELARTNMVVFQDAVAVMADALHVELDDIVWEGEFARATEKVDLGYMTIDEGCTTALKASWAGIAGGRRVIVLEILWKLGYTMEPDWPLETGYTVRIKGEPEVHAVLHMTGAPGWGMDDFGYITAMPAVHAIPVVCAAPPGIVEAPQLPLIVAAGAVRP